MWSCLLGCAVALECGAEFAAWLLEGVSGAAEGGGDEAAELFEDAVVLGLLFAFLLEFAVLLVLLVVLVGLLGLGGGLAGLLLVALLGLLALLLPLLWCLVVGVGFAGSLGVGGGGLVVGDLGAVLGLLALLALLAALAGALLGCALGAGVVDGDARVLVQGWLVDAALVVGLLGW